MNWFVNPLFMRCHVAWKVEETAKAGTQVAGHRTDGIALDGSMPKLRELTRMVQKKMSGVIAVSANRNLPGIRRRWALSNEANVYPLPRQCHTALQTVVGHGVWADKREMSAPSM